MSTMAIPKIRHGLGPLSHEGGVAFRVWAPHAEQVSVVGEFNGWSADAHPMESVDDGYWYLDIVGLTPGEQYKYRITNGDQQFDRIDPRAREVTNSVGNAIVHRPEYDWEDDAFQLPPWNELVIYEMHVGTFARELDDEPSGFEQVIERLDYLSDLGVNAIEFMPLAEFAGDVSLGYNPAHLYAIESAYGGPEKLKELVKQAHRRDMGVILDVVYNHFGPSDLDLWQFDGWSENGKGGIYFYNDWRSSTPWGDTRPDYGREEVRRFMLDNALMWLEEYHVDGLRFDMTLYMRTVDGSERNTIPEGWGLLQWLNAEIAEHFSGHITIAEDLRNNNYVTLDQSLGGAGCDSQWDAAFVHPLRRILTAPLDEHRSMKEVREALCHKYNVDVFERVVYSESHDEVSNGKHRLPSAIDVDNPAGYFAQKRSTLAAALVMTAPAIPMLFQGQELLADGWFDDARGIDWTLAERFDGIRQLYRDLIALRKNTVGVTRGLTGQQIAVTHVNESDKVIAFVRTDRGGPADDTLVVANFANAAYASYRVGVPLPGAWKLRFDSDSTDYSADFNGHASSVVQTQLRPYDGHLQSLTVALGRYSVLIYSQDAS